MLLLQADISGAEMKKMKPVLVNKNKDLVVDTIYGTGKVTYDTCHFLWYDDFVAYRTARINIHHWYQYDTVLYFASDNYVVHYNYCRYAKTVLYLRITNPETGEYNYFEIPRNNRLHLHNYNSLIYDRETEKLKKEVEPFIFRLNRENLNLR